MMRALSIAIALTLTSSALAQSAPAFQAGSVSPSTVSSTNTAPVMTANAELLMMVEQLQQEVQYLRGAVEEQAHQIKQLKQQGRDRYRDLDQRLLQLKPLSGSGNSGSGGSASVGAALGVVPPPASVKPTAKSDPKTGRELKSAPSGDQQREYQQAYDLIKQKKYNQAVDRLHAFISHYPNSDLTGNAYYWLGEVYLVMPKYEQARQAFTVVVGSFSTHRKAPDAMFKLGVTYDKLGNAEQAKFYLNEVVKRYAESSAAKLAKEYKAK